MEVSESNSDEQFIMLHGDLDLKIIEAQHLPNLSLIDVRQLRRCFTARDSYTIETRQHKPKVQFCNPYVEVSVSNVIVASTRVIKNTTNPKWNQYFHIPLAHPVNKLTFHVKDDDIFGAEIIGTVHIPASKIATGVFISNDFDILSSSKKPLTLNAKIHLVLQFTSFDENSRYEHGTASDKGGGVARSYFPLRKGCSVRLYQDAHVPERLSPEIELDDGKVFKHEKCWEDICSAISEAHHLIYIVGWSVFHKVKLVREETRPLPLGGDSTLGELLKFKSEEGVRVLMLVWDDKTSGDRFFKTGMMQTHDEETRKFFKHSSVTCVLTPRNASSKLGYIKQQAGTKTPRQPWHDLHCRVEGPAAYDVLINFEQRWRKATKWKEFGLRFKRVSRWHDDALLKIERVAWILSPAPSIKKDGSTSSQPDDPTLWISNEDDPESWHVQIFRSIDSGSVKGFPKTVEMVENKNLICSKKLVIDKSIQTGYIQAIRSAQHFIYIENQYFFGSSYAWPSYKNAGADNLIPMELALKIVSKIRAKERFAVYIVILMWPEGDPTSTTMQAILFWHVIWLLPRSYSSNGTFSPDRRKVEDEVMGSRPIEYVCKLPIKKIWLSNSRP